MRNEQGLLLFHRQAREWLAFLLGSGRQGAIQGMLAWLWASQISLQFASSRLPRSNKPGQACHGRPPRDVHTAGQLKGTSGRFKRGSWRFGSELQLRWRTEPPARGPSAQAPHPGPNPPVHECLAAGVRFLPVDLVDQGARPPCVSASRRVSALVSSTSAASPGTWPLLRMTRLMATCRALTGIVAAVGQPEKSDLADTSDDVLQPHAGRPPWRRRSGTPRFRPGLKVAERRPWGRSPSAGRPWGPHALADRAQHVGARPNGPPRAIDPIRR